MATRFDEYNFGVIDEFRRTGGTVKGFGDRLILLHHTGAKSGQERISPLLSLDDGPDAWLIVASKGGAPEHPAWFHNLRANPEASIEAAGRGLVEVTASVLPPQQRDVAWSRFTAVSPAFAQYQATAQRVIPIVKLVAR